MKHIGIHGIGAQVPLLITLLIRVIGPLKGQLKERLKASLLI